MNRLEGHNLDITQARYMDALEDHDFDTLEGIWRQAESDEALEVRLLELDARQLLDAEPEPARPAPVEAESRLLALQADLARPAPPQAEQLVEAIYTDYRCRVLVVDDEPHVLSVLRRTLAGEFDVVEAGSLLGAKEAFRHQAIDILLTDLCLKGPSWEDRSGIELMEWAKTESPRTVALLMSAYGETESVIDAINRGHVFQYLPKPFPRAEVILEILRRASHAFVLERKNQELLERLKDMNMELEERVRQRAGELLEAMRELVQMNKTLEKLALTDALTGLPNRRAMDRLAERDLLWRKRNPAPLAIGLVDIDHFKLVNTGHGWSGGDRVLAEVSRCLSDSLREIDHIGRYGGEEFMLIAPQADRHGAEVLGERLRRRVDELEIPYKGETVRVTVSIGLAVAEKDTTADLMAMKDACESALAAAKAGGRNQCVITTVSDDRPVQARRARG